MTQLLNKNNKCIPGGCYPHMISSEEISKNRYAVPHEQVFTYRCRCGNITTHTFKNEEQNQTVTQ